MVGKLRCTGFVFYFILIMTDLSTKNNGEILDHPIN